MPRPEPIAGLSRAIQCLRSKPRREATSSKNKLEAPTEGRSLAVQVYCLPPLLSPSPRLHPLRQRQVQPRGTCCFVFMSVAPFAFARSLGLGEFLVFVSERPVLLFFVFRALYPHCLIPVFIDVHPLRRGVKRKHEIAFAIVECPAESIIGKPVSWRRPRSIPRHTFYRHLFRHLRSLIGAAVTTRRVEMCLD